MGVLPSCNKHTRATVAVPTSEGAANPVNVNLPVTDEFGSGDLVKATGFALSIVRFLIDVLEVLPLESML